MGVSKIYYMNDQDFKNEVEKFTEYDEKLREDFFDYWSEPNKKGKMKWELEKTWDTKRRLKRWFDNHVKWTGSNLRITKTEYNAGSNTKLGTSEARINKAANW